MDISIQWDYCKIRIWLVLLIFSIFSAIDVIHYWLTKQPCILNISGLLCLAFLKSTLLSLCYYISHKNKIIHIIVSLFIGGFIFLSFINGMTFLFYGFGISRKLILIISETNFQEIKEFLPELVEKAHSVFISLKFLIIFLFFTVLWFFFPKIPGRIFIKISYAFSFLGLIYIFFVFATADWGKSNLFIYIRTYECISGVARNFRNIHELTSHPRSTPDFEGLTSKNLAKKIIVIIGESASRDHLSCYGYPLKTTPVLDSIIPHLLLFDDVIGSSISTAENIPRLLSFMTDEPDNKEWYEYTTILQLFKHLGYRTYWYSNQERTGKWSNLSGILSFDADEVKYLGRQDSEDHLSNKYDEVLLSPFEKLISKEDTLQLVFMHMMGSHFQYHMRYPVNRTKIRAEDVLRIKKSSWLNNNKASLIANYDNSICYSDSIIGSIIKKMSKLKDPAIVLYLSDHGENVYDDRDYRGRDPNFVKVPFIIYLNDAYKNANPVIISELKNALHHPFSSSELPQIILHLSGTQYILYDGERDPLSFEFQTRERFVDGVKYEHQKYNK